MAFYSHRCIVWILLLVTELCLADISDSKRESSDDNRVKRDSGVGDVAGVMADALNNIKNVMGNGQGNFANVAGELANQAGNQASQAAEMANQILQNSGLDLSGVPQTLMGTASSLYQIRNTSTIQDMLKNIRDQMSGDVSMDEMQERFDKLLTSEDFLKDTKDLQDEYGGPSSPDFTAALEQTMKTYMMNAGGAAPRVMASFTSCLGMVVAVVVAGMAPVLL